MNTTKQVTYGYAAELFRYCGGSGQLYWNERPVHHFKNARCCNMWNAKNAGRVAGCDKNSYVIIGIDGQAHRAHNLVWLINTGSWPEHYIDHIDHCGLNNRFENLREVSHMENTHNQPMRKNNTSGIHGVCFDKKTNKWHSRIMVSGKSVGLGWFSHLADAAAAREAANIRYGFHANHGANDNTVISARSIA